MIRAHMIISGRVQGVGFRVTAQLKALEMKLNGWVRNLSNGTVEMEVEGPKDEVNEFIEVIENGPSNFIKVDLIDVTTSTSTKGYTSFEIVN